MNTSEIAKLNPKELFDYFLENAGYSPQNPPQTAYSIRLGTKALFADDTDKLREKFFAQVKAIRDGRDRNLDKAGTKKSTVASLNQ